MKAKKRVPENSEQPKTLPAPSNEEMKDNLAPWQKEIVALAEARLSVGDERDLLPHMHRRAIALCRIVEDMAMGTSESEPSLEALAMVMEIVQEDIQVAKWLVLGRPLDPRWE